MNANSNAATRTKEQLDDVIASLFASRDGDPFAVRGWQTLSAHRRELERKANDEQARAQTLERLVVFRLMAVKLLHQIVTEVVAAQHRGEDTSDGRRIGRLLADAAEDFTVTIDELIKEFGGHDVKADNLAEKIWLHFLNVSRDEAINDASEILVQLATAPEQH
jgi:hypothetical protein